MADWVSGPNGNEFELLGGCGEFGKSLAKAPLKQPEILTPKLSIISKNVICLIWIGEMNFPDREIISHFETKRKSSLFQKNQRCLTAIKTNDENSETPDITYHITYSFEISAFLSERKIRGIFKISTIKF